MDIVILLFDKVTALDAIGPYEALSRLPGAKVHFVAKEAGPVRTDNGMLGLVADAAIAHVLEELKTNAYQRPDSPAAPDRAGMGIAEEDK